MQRKVSQTIQEDEQSIEGIDVQLLEKKLERYKETVGFIRDICGDYRDKPALGLEAIKVLLRGLRS